MAWPPFCAGGSAGVELESLTWWWWLTSQVFCFGRYFFCLFVFLSLLLSAKERESASFGKLDAFRRAPGRRSAEPSVLYDVGTCRRQEGTTRPATTVFVRNKAAVEGKLPTRVDSMSWEIEAMTQKVRKRYRPTRTRNVTLVLYSSSSTVGTPCGEGRNHLPYSGNSIFSSTVRILCCIIGLVYVCESSRFGLSQL